MAATYPHSKPTGDGFVVLDYVDEKLACMLEGARLPQALGPLLKPENIIAMREDLFARSVIGTEKYGTPLRVWNGRDSLVDLYQEILDAIMYSGQCQLEKRGDVGGNMLELLINLATQIAGELDKRYQDNGNQTR